MTDKVKRAKLAIGTGGLIGAAGAALAADSMREVPTLIGASSETATGTVPPFNWSISDYGLTLKNLGYSNGQWEIEVLKNGKFYNDLYMGLGQQLQIPLSQNSNAVFSFVGDGPNALKYMFLDEIQQHTVMAYPWWHTEGLVGGIIAAVAGVTIAVLGYSKLKKLRRSEEENKETK